MEAKHLGVLVDGRRIEDWMRDIPFMPQHALYEFCIPLADAIDNSGIDHQEFDPLYEFMDERHKFFEDKRDAEIEAGVKSGKLIVRPGKVYERNVFAMLAMRRMFGEDVVKDVFVDRQHLEYLQRSYDGNEHIIDCVINAAEELTLDISCMNMIIVLVNGRQIEMTNSEWGDFTRIG